MTTLSWKTQFTRPSVRVPLPAFLNASLLVLCPPCHGPQDSVSRHAFPFFPFLSPPMSLLVLCSVLCSALKHDGLLAAWLPTDCEFSPMPCFITSHLLPRLFCCLAFVQLL